MESGINMTMIWKHLHMVPNFIFKELILNVIISRQCTAKRSNHVSSAEVEVERVVTQWLTIQDRNFINRE
jgi:hypothetical protein